MICRFCKNECEKYPETYRYQCLHCDGFPDICYESLGALQREEVVIFHFMHDSAKYEMYFRRNSNQVSIFAWNIGKLTKLPIFPMVEPTPTNAREIFNRFLNLRVFI